MSQHNLHVHVYSGRENGLMLIGDAEALNALGKELQAAGALESSESTDNWPRQVAVVSRSSPYSDRQDYQVSVHLQTSPLPEALLKKPRSGLSTSAFLAIAVLAVVGAISLPIWLWRAL
jgi:hypothetical protein